MTDNREHRAVLVQCTKDKRDGTHEARDLYDTSAYFRKQRSYARAAGDSWYIQSAKYGLLEPTDSVPAYDLHAGQLGVDDRFEWAERIASALTSYPAPTVVEILGGAAYADPLTPELEQRGIDVVEPLRGLGIGERMAKLDEMTNESLEAFA
jgi:hypothetical protein